MGYVTQFFYHFFLSHLGNTEIWKKTDLHEQKSQLWWYTSVISVTQEAEVGKSQCEARLRLKEKKDRNKRHFYLFRYFYLPEK
jgi:hypothetical protein